MTIIGIDPGTNCGWAVRYGDNTMVSGVWNLAPKRHESAGMRFVRFRANLQTLIDQTRAAKRIPSVVAYEDVRRHLGIQAAHVYGGLVALIQLVCSENAIEHMGIPVADPKKLATGRGNAKKGDMVKAAEKKWNTWGLLEDEADARWIAEAAAKELAP